MAHSVITMNRMSKKKGGAKKDGYATEPTQLRLPVPLKRALEDLAARNFSTLTAEIVAASLKHLAEHGIEVKSDTEDGEAATTS